MTVRTTVDLEPSGGGGNRRGRRRDQGELEHSLDGVGVEADEWWGAVVCRLEVADEVLLVEDDMPASIVGGGDDGEGAGIRLKVMKDISEDVVG